MIVSQEARRCTYSKIFICFVFHNIENIHINKIIDITMYLIYFNN